MGFLLPIADEARLGGKARSLARLAAAGARTPAGFVVGDALFRALLGDRVIPAALDAAALGRLDELRAALLTAPFPAGFAEELAAALAGLGAARLSVRSSFVGEDEAGALAAGVYESRVDVPSAEVPAALRLVLASAVSPGALAYARAHGRPGAAPPVAVLVHGHVAGAAWGAAAVAPGAAAVVDGHGPLSPGAHALVTETASRLAALHGPVELEWAASGDEVTFLQLRPYQPTPAAPPWPGFAELPAGERAEDWRWDAAHNPAPLSPAHAGLVAFVDERCRTGLRQRVLGGYLFWSPGGAAAAPVAPARAAEAFAALRGQADAGLAALGDPPALEEALELFAEVYEPLFGVVQPAAKKARKGLEDFLRFNLPEALPRVPTLLGGVESAAAQRGRLAARVREAGDALSRAAAIDAYLVRFGDEAPAWDVATPLWRERPESLAGRLRAAAAAPPDDAAARAEAAAQEIRDRLPRMARLAWKNVLPVARAAAGIGEDDDALYARVQAAVRRALRALGERLHAAGALDAPDDVFFWPLSVARAAAAGHVPANGRALAAEGRAAVDRARALPPPVAGLPPGRRVLRGAGTGGRVIGRVRQHQDGAAVDAGDVLVARALLPTELPLLHPAAVITACGGPLDHVAAQARERGLPAVVGVEGATELPDGALVLVEADAGLVVLLDR